MLISDQCSFHGDLLYIDFPNICKLPNSETTLCNLFKMLYPMRTHLTL